MTGLATLLIIPLNGLLGLTPIISRVIKVARNLGCIAMLRKRGLLDV